MARRHDPVVDREAYLEQVTGETELARHDEQLDRQEEHHHREAGKAAPGGRPSEVHRGRGHRDGSPDELRAEFGVADPPLPGGLHHIPDAPVKHQKLHPKVPGPYYDGIMAHGVPIDVDKPPNHGRIAPEHTSRHGHGADVVHHEPPEWEPDPVPVYVVERGGGGKPIIKTAMNTQVLPVAGSDPQRIIGQDLRRRRIGLINEDTTHHARFDTDLGDLARGRGSILPAGATSYLWLDSQDSFFAVSNDSSTVKISFITEYELPGGG